MRDIDQREQSYARFSSALKFQSINSNEMKGQKKVKSKLARLKRLKEVEEGEKIIEKQR